MSYENILYTVENGIATLTLNRQATLNAFNDAMIAETIDAMKQADRNGNVRCIVLTGAGRGFSSGQDLSGFQERRGQCGRWWSRAGDRGWRRVHPNPSEGRRGL